MSAKNSGCCGGPPPEGVDACCVRDADAKAQGESGCGCGPSPSVRTDLPVVVVGAGPVGLAAAAHLVTRDLPVVVLEAADAVGASVRDWGHVRLFSPWQYCVDRAAAELLERSGWRPPPVDALPTGSDLYEHYLRPLAELPSLRGAVRTGRRVVAVSRDGLDKVVTKGRAASAFLVRTVDRDGRVEELRARAVIDASGTWSQPNPLGTAGLPARGEAELADRIHYGIPDVLGRDRARYAGRSVLVVGAGHSAANTLLALAELARTEPATTLSWATRGEDLGRLFGGGDADALPARGRLGTEVQRLVAEGRAVHLAGFRIEAVELHDGRVEVIGTRAGDRVVRSGIDAIVAATGQRPDLSMLREVRLSLDPALECPAALGPLIDPNVHSCGTVRPHGARELAQPEPGLFVVGTKSYGRAPTFLLATGYEQARSVVAQIAGDVEAAARVALALPETGVCSVERGAAPSGGCC